MSRLVFAGGGELDATTPAGRVLAGSQRVAIVTLAAAFRNPQTVRAAIHRWADALGVECDIIAAVRRADSLNPSMCAPISSADGVLVLDGSPAHLVGALKETPLLEAIVGAHADGATLVWSGAAAAAACDPMVDDRGGALTVGLRLYSGIATATGWDRWPHPRRRRLRRMLPDSVLFVALESGAAVQSTTVRANLAPNLAELSQASAEGTDRALPDSPAHESWMAIGGVIEAQRAGQPVNLRASD